MKASTPGPVMEHMVTDIAISTLPLLAESSSKVLVLIEQLGEQLRRSSAVFVTAPFVLQHNLVLLRCIHGSPDPRCSFQS